MALMILAGFIAIILLGIFVICLLGANVAGLVLLIDMMRKNIRPNNDQPNKWTIFTGWVFAYLVFITFSYRIISLILDRGLDMF